MLTVAHTAHRKLDAGLVARPSNSAAEYAEYNLLRNQVKPALLEPLEAAIRASTFVSLDGLPYPVKYRNQGALEEWRRLFNAHDWSRCMWDAWAMAHATCLDCINELCWQVDQHVGRNLLRRRSARWPDAAFPTVVKWAANIHFERKRGALIETTAALDTLLMQSDIDDTLPMQLFAPPFDAQYLQLNRATAEHFRTAEDRANGRWIEGVFCFVSRPSPSDDRKEFITVVELVIVYATNDKGISAQLLRGPLLTPDQTVVDWAKGILMEQNDQRTSHGDVLMKLINNMVKVFLYLGLKDVRKEVNVEHSAALQRLREVGPKKQAKLLRRLGSLYDRITVGPAATPAILLGPGAAGIKAPHWRRGHFRAQPYGPGRSSRKLIFVAPILIHANRLGDQVPPPKAYALTTGLSQLN